MRKIFKLVKREYIEAVKTKGFVIMLIGAPLMMGGSGLAMALLKDQVDTSDKRVVILDHTGVLADTLITAAEARNARDVYDEEKDQKVKPAYLLSSVKPDTANLRAQRLALSDSVRSGALHAFVEIGASVLLPSLDPQQAQIAFHAENAPMDDVRDWIRWPLNDQLRRLRMEAANVSVDAVPDLFWWINVDPLSLVTRTETGEISDAERSNELESILVPAVMTMLMFLMMMMGAMPQLNAVMEEKLGRIAEVILGSLRPFQFMLGKVLGGLAVALTGSAVYVIGGVLYIQHMGWERYIPYDVLPWFLIYMVLNIFMLGSVLASLGSVCNDARDAQNLTFPAILPAMFPMFILFPVLKEPMSSFSTIMSLIPPFTPMLMTLRLSTPMTIPAWQPWTGLAGVLLFTVFAVWGGGRLFRSGILMQGGTLSFGNLVKWTLRG